MKRIIRLTESDLTRIVKRVISEQKPLTNCVSQTDLIKWLESKAYINKNVSTGRGDITFMKKCGNAKSEITVFVNPGGCVEKINEAQFVYVGSNDNESGQSVWDIDYYKKDLTPKQNLDSVQSKIKNAVNSGYDKYKFAIKGCTSGFFS